MHHDARTKVTGLLGHPVDHSLSPEMHNAAFTSRGINYCYLAFPVRPEALAPAVEGIRALGFRGVNVTIPHKENVIPLLDSVDEEAAFIGAVNTVVNEDGHLRGFNTDGRGFMKSLGEKGISVKGRNVFIVGAGGASRAVGYYLSAEAGTLTIHDLDSAKGSHLVRDLTKLNPSVLFADDSRRVHAADVIINATPLGLKTNDALPFSVSTLSSRNTVIDLIYRDTPLLHAAQDRGCTTMNGLGMLLWQGVLAFELWTGIEAPVEIMRETLVAGFRKQRE